MEELEEELELVDELALLEELEDELELLELGIPVEELEDELLEELDDELPATPLDELELEEVDDDELLDELELLELDDDEPVSSPPWVTKSPSPPQALKAATTIPTVSARKDFPAAPCNPIENMWNTPHKCEYDCIPEQGIWRYIFYWRRFLRQKPPSALVSRDYHDTPNGAENAMSKAGTQGVQLLF